MDEAAAMGDLHMDILHRKHAKAKVMLAQVSQGQLTDQCHTHIRPLVWLQRALRILTQTECSLTLFEGSRFTIFS